MEVLVTKSSLVCWYLRMYWLQYRAYPGFQRFLALGELGPKSRVAGDWWRGGAEARNLWEQMSLISLPCSDDWQLALRFSALNKFAGLDKFRGAVPNRSSVFFVHPLLRPRVYQAWNSKRMSSWACVLWCRCSSVSELSVRFVSSLLWLKKCSRLWCPLSSHELILYLTVVFSEYGVPWSRYSRSVRDAE